MNSSPREASNAPRSSSRPVSKSQLLYLSRAEVTAVGLGIDEVFRLLEEVFREKAAGRVEMPPKPGVHPAKDAFLHAMPAFIPSLGAVGVKWVSGYPGNPQRGLPHISGLLILNDPVTGLPLAVMDCTWITAKRTGAATGLAARYLARPGSRVVGILGCGVQGRANLEALLALFPIEDVRAYDTDLEAARIFAQETNERFRVAATPVKKPREAVTGCDIVVTAGPILREPHATIQAGWLGRGAFASLVDFDAYWSRDALREVDKWCTDDVPQLDHYKGLGYFRDIPTVYADLGELVAGTKIGREVSEERTMTCNLGLALEDVAIGARIYSRALTQGIGTWLPL